MKILLRLKKVDFIANENYVILYTMTKNIGIYKDQIIFSGPNFWCSF